MTKIISNSTWTLRARAIPFLSCCLCSNKHKHNEADDDDDDALQRAQRQEEEEEQADQDVDNKKCSCCDFYAGRSRSPRAGAAHQVPLEVDSDAGVSGMSL